MTIQALIRSFYGYGQVFAHATLSLDAGERYGKALDKVMSILKEKPFTEYTLSIREKCMDSFLSGFTQTLINHGQK